MPEQAIRRWAPEISQVWPPQEWAQPWRPSLNLFEIRCLVRDAQEAQGFRDVAALLTAGRARDGRRSTQCRHDSDRLVAPITCTALIGDGSFCRMLIQSPGCNSRISFSKIDSPCFCFFTMSSTTTHSFNVRPSGSADVRLTRSSRQNTTRYISARSGSREIRLPAASAGS